MRNAFVLGVCIAVAATAQPVRAADDASIGYQAIRPSLVKVWAFDKTGRPTQSGTGIVVGTNDAYSIVLTATHVVAGAASIKVDVSRDVHDVRARVERTGPRDLTLLEIRRGNLHSARFAPRSRAVVEGNVVAVAGYVKNDELIGVVGQEPRVLFPGTVSSKPENGAYLELENLHIEEGLSGGAVFDPASGQILGIVTSRTSDRRGGFADSAALVVMPFLLANNIGTPVQAPVAGVAPAPPQRSAPLQRSAPPLGSPDLHPVAFAALQTPVTLPIPRPVSSAQAMVEQDVVRGEGVTWQVGNVQPQRFVYEHAGCRMAVSIDVRSLRFSAGDSALLSVTLQQRAAATSACADFADTAPVRGTYRAVAKSFDGRHVTIRFAYAGDPAIGERFPSDASLDANLDSVDATGTLQFFGRDWSGAVTLPLVKSAVSAVSKSR